MKPDFSPTTYTATFNIDREGFYHRIKLSRSSLSFNQTEFLCEIVDEIERISLLVKASRCPGLLSTMEDRLNSLMDLRGRVTQLEDDETLLQEILHYYGVGLTFGDGVVSLHYWTDGGDYLADALPKAMLELILLFVFSQVKVEASYQGGQR